MTSQVSYRIINSISGWSPAPIKVDSVSFQGGTTHTFLSCAAGPQVTRVRVDSNINAGSLDRRKYGSVQCDECGVIALPARAQPGRVYNLRLIGRPTAPATLAMMRPRFPIPCSSNCASSTTSSRTLSPPRHWRSEGSAFVKDRSPSLALGKWLAEI